MFRKKSDYIIATPSAITRRLRRQRAFNIVSVLVLASALVYITNHQWKPADGIDPGTAASTGMAGQPAREQAPAPQDAALSIDKSFLRTALSDYIKLGEFPDQLGFNDSNLYINYTIDQDLQDWATQRLKRYNPDYGVFVAIDPDTGKILAMTSSRRDEQLSAELALNATYPAASTFKVITAAAAIEEGVATPSTVFAFNGKSTSLYKSQVYQVKENKWTRRMSFKTAFAKSVNPIFGRLGAQDLGAQTLVEYAERFGFNARFVSDFEFDNGRITIDQADDWEAAESASGYTRRNTLGPVHGAALAAAIANGGKLISPSIVESVTDGSNKVLYTFDKPVMIDAISAESAAAVRELMSATLTEGTGRKSFRNFVRQKFTDVEAGGKSGHLRGELPEGTYDWFIGYGERDNRKIAYAMMCINKEKWYVKSSTFAREALEHYFSRDNTKVTRNTHPESQAETS